MAANAVIVHLFLQFNIRLRMENFFDAVYSIVYAIRDQSGAFARAFLSANTHNDGKMNV